VYAVLYHKYTTAKKKKYFDGFVILKPQQHQALLMSQEGKQVSQKKKTNLPLCFQPPPAKLDHKAGGRSGTCWLS
jgi:hypothetical protein